MKKILLTITSLYGGGAERVVSVWSKQLKEKGYDVSILVCARYSGEYKILDSVPIYSVAETHADFCKLSFYQRFKCFRRLIKEISPDVMINFLPKMQIWMMLATMFINVRKIETIRVSPWNIELGKFEEFLWKRCYDRADAVILQTQQQGEYFTKNVQRKSVVVSNPISEQYKINYKTEYNQAKKFIAMGRVCEQKNFELAIRAFKLAVENNKQLCLEIYGAGEPSYENKLNELIIQQGLENNVRLMGRTNDVLNILKNADSFIMSSDFEGLPNALIESMCIGLPCISTDCRTGPRDLIDNGENGFLVPVGDVDALSKAILELAQLSEEQAKELGQKARQKVLDVCSEEKSLNTLIKVIEG